MKSLCPGYTALVIGATGVIGQAFCEALSSDPSCARVLRLSRSIYPEFDLGNPVSLSGLISGLDATQPIAVVIDASGVLSIDGQGPEKSLSAISEWSFNRVMQINALGPLLLLRELVPRLARDRCLYGKLSARVGSISDNRLGGWYSYRASKAALNMLLQTAAIELHRKLPGLVVAALQPGTVVSPLSRRFVSDSTQTVSPHEAVNGLLTALDSLPAAAGAHFIDYRGRMIDW